jgi:lysozyme
MTTVDGVDVSSWQHPGGAPIEWAQLFQAGKRFVMVKCSQGVGYVNPYFADDVKDARAVGLLVGAYHFAEPYANSAPDEAAFALRAVEGVTLDLGLSLDFESVGALTSPDTGDWAHAWLDAVAPHVHPVGLYAPDDLYGAMLGAPWGYNRWAINVGGNAAVPGAWMTQTGSGEVAGIQGTTDLDTLSNIRGVNPGPGGGVPPPVTPTPGPAPEPEPEPEPEPGPKPPTEVFDVETPELSVTDPGPGVVSQPVKVVQGIINSVYGCAVGAGGLDGRFGPDTANGVKAFQAGHDLAVDGVVGPLTWQKLVDG